jgi:hypothetical protein
LTNVVVGLLLTLALGAFGCGNSLIPGTLYDRPLYSVSGTINPAGGLGQARHPIVGVLWTDPLQRKPDVPTPARWLRSRVDVASDTFSVELFRPPPPEAVVDLVDPSGETSRIALAEMVILDDPDDDGTFRVSGPRAVIAPPDLYLAGAIDVLTYVVTPFASPQLTSPLTVAGQSGYALLSYNCNGQSSTATTLVAGPSTEMILQASQTFPDVRPCRESHGP